MNGLKVLKVQVLDEIAKLNTLIEEASSIQHKRQSNLAIRAGASVLHDFYSGIENIFRNIAKSIDEKTPSGMSWHLELLNQMTLDIEELRPPVIKKETAAELEQYLRFRHLFRNRYGFSLEWSLIKVLLSKLPETLCSIENEINGFFDKVLKKPS